MSYLSQATKPQTKAPVITVVASPGAGKTTLAALFPSPIFIQAESSGTVFETWAVNVQPALMPELPDPSRKRGVSVKEIVLDQIRELLTQPHDFKTLVIDSVTSMSSLFEKEIVEFDTNGASNIGDAAGGFHKGYNVLASYHAEVRSACEHLRKTGMSIIFLAHSGIMKMKNRPDSGEYTAFTLDMHEKSRVFYINHSDAVLYLKNSEIIIGEETNKKGQTTKFGKIRNTGDRVLITSSDGTIGYVDAKNRYDMDQEIPVNKGENPILQYIPFFNTKGD